MKWTIEKKLLPIKIHYFLFNAALACVVPILPVYAKQLGMSALSVGVIYTILPFVILLAKPIFGMVADRFKILKPMLVIFVLITAVAMLCINFLQMLTPTLQNAYLSCQDSKIFVEKENSGNNYSVFCMSCANLNCEENITVIDKEQFNNQLSETEPLEFAINITTFSTSGECNNLSEIYFCSQINFTNSSENYRRTSNQTLIFVLFILLIIIAWMSFGVSVSLSDAACYNNLQNRMHLYGRQRLWGTIGWGASAAFTGYLNDIFTTDYYNFSPGFYTLVILLICDLFAVYSLEMKDAEINKTIFHDVGSILIQLNILMTLFGVLFIGALTGLCRSYLLWYLRSLHGSQLLLGLTSTVQCFLGELPFFLLAGWLLQKIGHECVVILAFVAYGVRFIGYSFIPNPWWVLPLELLQGPCFASFYSAMTSYAKKASQKGTEAAMQGLLGGTFEGLGAAVGSLLGGMCFNNYSGSTIFFWTGIIAFAGGICFTVGQRLVR